MIVMYGDNNTLIIALVESEIATLREQQTLMYEGFRQLVKDIVVIYGKDKEELIALIRSAGITVTEELAAKYRRGERTDTPSKVS